jgi:hypothetical protein
LERAAELALDAQNVAQIRLSGIQPRPLTCATNNTISARHASTILP